jgi:aromatic-L-amino-acid/L-tryptophan decarboxylase
MPEKASRYRFGVKNASANWASTLTRSRFGDATCHDGKMTPEEFRIAGHELIDWIADLRASIDQRPVLAQVVPGHVRSGFPSTPPTETSTISELIAQLDCVVVPGVTQVQHPMHFGWFPSNSSLSSVLGDIASSGIGSLGITWQSSPALTEVEEVTNDWLRQLCGLSDVWHGVIQDTASTACLVAMLSARERASDHSQTRGGLQGEAAPLVVYASPQCHSSIPKAVLLAGFGAENLRHVAVDPVTYALSPDALREAMRADVVAGRKPAAVILGLGTTGTTAFDPISPVVQIAAEFGAWVHVDAAMAGSALLLPECRHLFEGIEGADSISWNPHKWMGTALDCSMYLVRDPQHLIRVMSSNASYLQSSSDGQVVQYKDWGIPLGRRFRASKLWFHLALDGVESIQARLRRDLDNAQWFAAQVAAEPNWKILAPVALQTICIRHEPTGLTPEELDAHTLRWVNQINESGAAFMSSAVLDGRWMVRVSIGVEATERHHVEALWQLIRAAVASES